MGSAAEFKFKVGGKGSRLPQYLELDGSDHMDTPIEPKVTGHVPEWISGSLYRNGSGIFRVGQDSWKHLFDGFAVLHRWSVHNGTVTFRSSILDTEHYQKCVKANRLIGDNFGSSFPDPCRTLFDKLFNYFIPRPPSESDNTGVNIVEVGDRLFALTESALINEVKPDTLLVKEKFKLSDKLALHTGTAHPIRSQDGRWMYYYGTNMNFKQAYNFVRIPISDDATKNPFHGAEVVARIPSRWKMNIGYAHSFGVTDNYFVHIEQPLTLSLPRIMTLNIRGAPISDSFVCHPNEPMSFILVSKKTGEKIPITYLAPHGFVFHFINCYEEADHVICDICLYNSSEIIRSAYIEQIINSINSDKSSQLPEANYARFVLPLSLAGAKPGENLVKLPDSCATAVLREGTTDTLDVTREKMFDDSYSFDLPRINDDYAGIKFRYTYGTTIFASDRRLLKLDAVERSVAEWTCESTHQPGEPVFVPRPGSTQEDDGVVMCTILANTTDYSSYLVILDAHSFKEIARASVPSDMKMSLTFHGFFSQRH